MHQLRSTDPAIRKNAIMRCHVRWWHASDTELTNVMRAANAPASAISDILAVVQGCTACREWHRPEPRYIATFRLVEEFNLEVQVDQMFYHSILQPQLGRIVILHLVDVCIRWSSTCILATESEIEILAAISQTWVSVFGPMGYLGDGRKESGLRGQAAFGWASANGISITYKAPRHMAWIVERANDIIRVGLHRTESQLSNESLVTTSSHALAILTFMKNSVTVVNKHTPYQALLGRQPAILAPLECGHIGQVDSQSRLETNSKHEARIRYITACGIIEGCAAERLKRVHRSKTRAAIENLDFRVGDAVDLWFEPTNKDTSGWRGPADIKAVNASIGNITARMQGRTLDRRSGEVRLHVP